MTVEPRLIDILKSMGLTEYEAHGYSILALAGPLPAVEIADLTKIPRPRIYDILKKLDQRGAILIQQGKPTKYKAISPSELTELIEKQEEQKVDTIKALGDEFVKRVEPLYNRMILPKELAWVIKGRGNLKKRAITMITSARRISIMTSHKKSVLLADKRARKKLGKLKVRCLIDEVIDDMPEIETKILPATEKFGMIIADGRECLILTQEGASSEYNAGILIMNPDICVGFERNFDFIWKNI